LAVEYDPIVPSHARTFEGVAAMMVFFGFSPIVLKTVERFYRGTNRR
jgi:hypothetical protein